MLELKKFYKNYKRRSDSEIRTLLEKIKPVHFEDGEYYYLSKNQFNSIIDRPRSVAYTFSVELGEQVSLIFFKEINFLVKSSSRFFLKPDIGEVFDQINDIDLNKISAVYIKINSEQKIPNTNDEHFLMKAILLINIKQLRKDKLKNIDKNWKKLNKNNEN